MMAGIARAAVALVVVVAAGCSTSTPGSTGNGASASASNSAKAKQLPQPRDLLLQDGEPTPFGPATVGPVGSSFFTGARPAECTAAVLFKGSPLRPTGPIGEAESAYSSGSKATYAESVGVYDHALNPHDVVESGLKAVSECHGDAFALGPRSEFGPLQLSYSGLPADGVLVWTMGRPDWSCDYGLAVVSQAALLISSCDSKRAFSMAQWAAKRRAQLDARV